MSYLPPRGTDFANVRSLNAAFLGLLRSGEAGRSLRRQLPRELRAVVTRLSGLQLRRLADTPFLLLSFREHDEEFRRMLETETYIRDLFQVGRASDDRERLVTASLGFVWQLAQHNPFAARLVSGASPRWCERLAESTLLQVLQAGANCPELVEVRYSERREVWDKLLGAGLDSRPRVHRAAQMAVLHSLLTQNERTSSHRLRAAACRKPVPVKRLDRQLRRP